MTTQPGREARWRTLLDERQAELLAEFERQQASLGDIRRGRADSVDDEHDPEGPTLSAEWSRVEGLSAGLRAELKAVDSALRRLDDGRYGVCTNCGEAIAEGRLEARPAAEHCIRCAARR